ncbi:phospholipase D family protein [Paenibacillus sambharensis]|nr:phospholipase D family protein [Paenibacillus sambharensis]
MKLNDMSRLDQRLHGNMRLLKRLSWKWLLAAALLIAYLTTIIVHTYKPLPAGLSYESGVYRTSDVEMLVNLSYEQNGSRVYQDEIYQAWLDAIRQAEKWIVIDMFLFNGFTDTGKHYPPLSDLIADAITLQKALHPEMKVIVITDEVNTTYGSHASPVMKRLAEAGAEVVYTNLDKLRDSNPLYSGAWRMFAQWFGQEGNGWLLNPFGSGAPEVTARSYMKLLNVKANHRKLLMTEHTAIVTSANMHDASAKNSNIAFRFGGPILKDVWEAEKAVIAMSGGPDIELDFYSAGLAGGEVSITTANLDYNSPDLAELRWLTEGKIAKQVERSIEGAKPGERIWIGMFYLADRDVVNALAEASDRKVDVRLILDPNRMAFGHGKVGLPNIPVAAELIKRSGGAVQIRWYKTGEEQYHTKLMVVQGKTGVVMIGGSANYTRRNLDDLNLEANLMITAARESKIAMQAVQYFERLWHNEDGMYTVPYEAYEEKLPIGKQFLYGVQKLLGFTTY